MKTFKIHLLMLLTAILTLSAGCRSFTYEGPHGEKLKSWSFANQTTIGEFTLSTNGTATLKDYGNDQVQGVKAIAEGVAKGVIAGAKPGP